MAGRLRQAREVKQSTEHGKSTLGVGEVKDKLSRQIHGIAADELNKT